MGTHPDPPVEPSKPPATPAVPAPEPSGHLVEDEASRLTRAGALWTALTLGFLVLILLLVFVVQNPDQVPFQFLGWHWNLSLGVATLFAAIAGGLVTVAVGMVRIIQLRRVAKKSLKGH
ncbi:MAG: DUF1049 domain-containing protein [Mycobacterium sp.]|nr:DUF1049 domain-containing protein [Mycobacterium sp.]